MIDDPSVNDNRKYSYPEKSSQWRQEYSIIYDIIQHESTVIDFGCGDGSLLNFLKKKSITGIGYDVSECAVRSCHYKGIKAICDLIDKHHPELQDNQFEYAICNVTMQMVSYPEKLLEEMIRVARYQVISFPNFANYKNRLDMVFNGRMPQPMLFGYQWYSTGHIHQLSIKDFHNFLYKFRNLMILSEYHIGFGESFLRKYLVRNFPNLFATISIFLLRKDSDK